VGGLGFQGEDMSCIRKGYLFIALSLCALTVSLCGISWAQQVFGSIIGTVTDPSGSAVANAKVTISEVNKGTSSDTMTNESGQYTKGQLIPGTYKVTIESAGFNKVSSNELTVSVDQTVQFNASMQVGNVNQTVEVTAAAPLLQTDKADIAQTFSSQQISELPSIGRNLQAFQLLNPGVVKTSWGHAASENPQGSVQTYSNGLPFYMTGYYLDGTVNQDPILGIIVINPTFDSVNEVKQSNQAYDAEFDSFAAGLNVYSTKSGTNQFHGDAYDYLYLNTPGFQDFGRNPFTEPTGAPTTRQNQFGGSIGGRIIKDKLFFFGDAQLSRNQKGGSVITSVPTAAERNGNLSDWLSLNSSYQIYDPMTGSPTTGVGRQPFANNQIPTGRLSPQAQAILNYFPLPNYTGNGTIPYNNYITSGGLTFNANQWDTRWDYYMSEKDTFFGRYSYAGFEQHAPGAFGSLAGGPAFATTNFAGNSNVLNQSLAAGWTHTYSPSVINEFRFGYMRYHVNTSPNGYGTQPVANLIPGLNLDNTYTSGLPAFNIKNTNDLTEQLGYSLTINQCNCPLEEFERQFQFVDNLSKISGKHSMKFGADVRYALNLRVPSDTHRAGELTFESGNTAAVNVDGSTSGGLGLASYLLGNVTTFGRYVSSSTNAQERQKRMFWYGQDEWRATSKLTINYGVRWEMVFPETVNAPGNGAALNLATGQLDVLGVGEVSNHGYQQMNWHNFAPRIGIAYQLTPKTVIRAGYGWTYSMGTFGSTFGHNVTQNPPVLANQSLTQNNTCGNNFCDVFNLAQGPPAFQPLTPDANGHIDPPKTGLYLKARPSVFTMPVAYAYNFTVQQQLSPKISVSGSYVGNQGRHGPLGNNNDFDANPIQYVPGGSSSYQYSPYYAKFGGWSQGVDYYCNCANSRYDSFQGIFTIKPTAGYSLQGNYTYQLAQGDGNGPANNYTFTYDRPLGYGRVANLPNQSWVLVNTYEVPFGKGRQFGSHVNRFVDAALGGWNLSGIFSYYSGLSYMPSIGTYTDDQPHPYTGPNAVPDIGSGSPYAANKNRNQWNLGGFGGPFLLPGATAFGNYPINSLYGPQFVNLDASLMKSFSITERMKFVLRVDSTNALNHTNLGLPNGDISSATAGQITNIAFSGNGGGMRRLQYSGTINW
jgi:hypothetical protein